MKLSAKGFNKKLLDETMMSGPALLSTIEQTKSLGNIGDEVLSKFKIKKVKSDQLYSYKIRAAIHEVVLKRFGKEALFYLGYTQMDGYKKIFEALGDPFGNFRKNQIKKLRSSNFSTAARARDKFLELLAKTVTQLNAKSIFCPSNDCLVSYRVLSESKGIYTLCNAVMKKHHAFNTGAFTKQLTDIIGDNWTWKLSSNQKQMHQGDGWANHAWNIEFFPKNEKKDLDIYVADLENRKDAKDKFIINVLNDSVKSRKSAEKQKELSEQQRSKLASISSQIGKYIPPQIHDALFAGKYDTEIKTRRRKLTVFFSDIKNFTSTSENLQPEDLTRYLNEYFSEMTKIAIDHGATIDKYIGDAVMLFFGDPETKGEREDARSCVEMALRMQERMEELREKWLNEGFADPFQIRVGLNTGYCNVGNFGSDQRLTYTIIGGEVNVAARLESAAEANGILMSYETYAHVQDMVEVTQKEAIKMKGINREIKIYAVEGRKEVVETKAKPTKAKKPTKKELTKIEHLEKESKQLKKSIKLLTERIKKLES